MINPYEQEYTEKKARKTLLAGLTEEEKKQRIRERKKQRHKKIWPLLKQEALRAYSDGDPKCVCCGEKQSAFLTLDHINNDGFLHRQAAGTSALLYYLKARNFPFKDLIKVSCFNCNMGRRVNGGICPHIIKTKNQQTIGLSN